MDANQTAHLQPRFLENESARRPFRLLCEHCVLIVYHSIDVQIEEPYWPLLLVAAAGEKFPLWRR